jgi:hypothetical protein
MYFLMRSPVQPLAVRAENPVHYKTAARTVNGLIVYAGWGGS